MTTEKILDPHDTIWALRYALQHAQETIAALQDIVGDSDRPLDIMDLRYGLTALEEDTEAVRAAGDLVDKSLMPNR